jgi:hypothetical protein
MESYTFHPQEDIFSIGWGTWHIAAHESSYKTELVLKQEWRYGKHKTAKNQFDIQSQLFAADGLSEVFVPQCFEFMNQDDPKWEQLLPKMQNEWNSRPGCPNTACNAIISERVSPISEQALRGIVKKYDYHDRDWEELFMSKRNLNCLPEIWLGRRTKFHPQQLPIPRLSLLIDSVEELHLPCRDYAKGMAQALATLHWGIRTDGACISFKLGHPRGKSSDDNLLLEDHDLWAFMSGHCKAIEADESGLMAIAKAFWKMQPYCPRPHAKLRRDQKLWEIFAAEYIRVGTDIVTQSPREGEDVEELKSLVPRAIAKIVNTRKKLCRDRKPRSYYKIRRDDSSDDWDDWSDDRDHESD